MKGQLLLRLVVAGAAALLAAGATVCVPRLFACEIGDPPVEILASWPREQYLLVYFQDDDGNESRAVQPLQQALKQYGRRVNVKPVPSPVRSASVEDSPAVLVSPRGTVLACFGEPPGAEQVTAVFESPGRVALVESLKKYDSVFLCLLDPESSQRKETAAVLKEGVKFARELSALSTGVLVVDPSRDEEEYLVRSIYAQMGRPPVGGQPVVALVCASGRVADVTVGVPSLEQVIDRLQRIYHEGGILDPSRFGEDLLMVW